MHLELFEEELDLVERVGEVSLLDLQGLVPDPDEELGRVGLEAALLVLYVADLRDDVP